MDDHGSDMGGHGLLQLILAIPWAIMAMPWVSVALPWHEDGRPWSSVASPTIVHGIAMALSWSGHV